MRTGIRARRTIHPPRPKNHLLVDHHVVHVNIGRIVVIARRPRGGASIIARHTRRTQRRPSSVALYVMCYASLWLGVLFFFRAVWFRGNIIPYLYCTKAKTKTKVEKGEKKRESCRRSPPSYPRRSGAEEHE